LIWSAIGLVLRAAAAAAFAVGFAVLVGAAVVNARFSAADLHFGAVMTVMPITDLLGVGVEALFAFAALGLLALAGLKLADGAGSRGAVAIALTLGALAAAIWLVGVVDGDEWALFAPIAIALGTVPFVITGIVWAETSGPPSAVPRMVLLRLLDGASRPTVAGRLKANTARVLSLLSLLMAVGAALTLESLRLRPVVLVLVVLAAVLFPLCPSGPRRLADKRVRNLLLSGTLLVSALAALWREHEWATWAFVFAVAMGVLSFAAANLDVSSSRLAAIVLASALVTGGIVGYTGAREAPTVRFIIAVPPGADVVCGVHVASTGERLWYADMATPGDGNDLVSLPRTGLLALIIGPNGAFDRWRDRAREFAASFLATRPLQGFGRPPEGVCEPNRLPPPKASEASELATQFAPRLVLDRDDGFWPIPVPGIFGLRDGRHRTCRDARFSSCDRLRDVRSLPWSGGRGQWIEFPGPNDDKGAQRGAMLAALGSDDPERTGQAYFFVTRKPESPSPWSVQYWFFYLFNYQPGAPGGWHEGDFEHVGLVFSADKRPRYVWMARHDDEGRGFAWEEPSLRPPNDHVTIYVAKGSHASYDSCGRQHRQKLLGFIDDRPVCEPGRQLVLTDPVLRDLSLVPWACWEGHFGHKSTVANPVSADAPRSPLWQQDFEHPAAAPCYGVREDPRRDEPGEEVNDPEAGAKLAAGGGRLDALFDDCEDWTTPPATGVYLAACDPASLRRFFDSGLMLRDEERVRITAPGDVTASSDREPMVPAVRRDARGTSFDGWEIVGLRDSRPAVYAACYDADGRPLTARFPAATLRRDETVVIDDRNGGEWRLRRRDGSALAATSPQIADEADENQVEPGRGVRARCRRPAAATAR
jgi:hypothetical protein